MWSTLSQLLSLQVKILDIRKSNIYIEDLIKIIKKHTIYLTCIYKWMFIVRVISLKHSYLIGIQYNRTINSLNCWINLNNNKPVLPFYQLTLPTFGLNSNWCARQTDIKAMTLIYLPLLVIFVTTIGE